MDKDEIIKQLQDELDATKQELTATKEHLKKYTAPERNRKYYEANFYVDSKVLDDETMPSLHPLLLDDTDNHEV